MAKLVSKVYGDALFEASMAKNEMDTLYEEVCALVPIFNDNPELSVLLKNPQIAKEDKVAIIKEVFSGKISEMLVGFLAIVVEKDRQSDILPIFNYFIVKVKEYNKIGAVYVTSATELKEGQKADLEKKLLESTPYVKVEMNYQVDPEIMGGLVVRIGDHVVDSSLKTRLYELKKELSRLQFA